MRYNAQLYLTMQHCYSLLVDLASGKSFISSLLCSIITIYWLTQVQRRVSSPLYYAALLQSTGLLKLREEFPLISRAEQGVLDPRDCYLAETSARPMWTTYDTVHAKPYVSRGRRGCPNELST